MYNSHDLAVSIKTEAKKQNIQVKEMLEKCELGNNTMSAMYHGKSIAFDSLAKIADYLNCSVDYLLGRTDNPTSHIKATPLNSKLVHLLSQLTPEQQEFISAQIKGLLNAKK